MKPYNKLPTQPVYTVNVNPYSGNSTYGPLPPNSQAPVVSVEICTYTFTCMDIHMCIYMYIHMYGGVHVIFHSLVRWIFHVRLISPCVFT